MRRIIIVLFLALFSQSLFSQNLVSLDPSKSLEIRAGDVILLPLYCYTCEILESETGSPFSHSGVVLEDESGDLVVAEALGDTHWVPLAEFLGRTEKEKMAGLYRPKEFHFLWARDPEGFSKFKINLRRIFRTKYLGLGFDKKYLWDNYDSEGKELLYCSEFVSKFLNEFLTLEVEPAPMSFLKHWDYWVRYYGGVNEVPQGKLGNSPAYFSRSELFFFVRYLGNK
ncbi:MAG: hypothetical protein HOM21_14470 [Halobacteriovoraceae bacterium]|jgi:hypothetical protein|nr:hypothetical protein [Halobacteriovoraceae bacterium]